MDGPPRSQLSSLCTDADIICPLQDKLCDTSWKHLRFFFLCIPSVYPPSTVPISQLISRSFLVHRCFQEISLFLFAYHIRLVAGKSSACIEHLCRRTPLTPESHRSQFRLSLVDSLQPAHLRQTVRSVCTYSDGRLCADTRRGIGL